jgi:hypothetical protein
MIKDILTKAGFIEGESFKETCFLKPPKTTYCVYFDSFNSRGSDERNRLKEHSISVEMYSYKSDPQSEAKIENVLDAFGIEYDKSDRYWIESEQLYQTIYKFGYIEK